MDQINTNSIANRIRTLIAREDAGDVTRAARRLGLSIHDMCHLEETLARDSEWQRILADVVRRYRVDACWLLTGREDVSTAELDPEDRIRLAHLLVDVSHLIFAEHAARGRHTAPH